MDFECWHEMSHDLCIDFKDILGKLGICGWMAWPSAYYYEEDQ